MKFNKAKLAALAMSAFIGTALLGFSAFAEGLEEHDATPGTQQETEITTKGEATIKAIEFTSDGKVKITYSDDSVKNDTAKVDEKKEPTCEEDGYVRYAYQIAGELSARVSEVFPLDALGHKVSSSPKTETYDEALHPADGHYVGTKYTGYYCTREHKDEKGNVYTLWMTKDGSQMSKEPEEIYQIEGSGMTKFQDIITHKWVQVGKPIIIDDQYVELDANDQPVLKYSDIGGRYDVQYYCEIGGEYKKHSELYGDYIYLEPEESISEIYNVAYKNIKGYYYGTPYEARYISPRIPANPDTSKIVLIDCEKPGEYVEIYRSFYGAPEKGADPNVITKTYLYTTRYGLEIDAESLIFDQEGNVTAIKGDQVTGIESASTKVVAPQHVYSGKVEVVKKSPNMSYTFEYPLSTNSGFGIKFYNNSCKEEGTYTIKCECVGGNTEMDAINGTFPWITQKEVKVAPNPDAHKIAVGYDKKAIDLAVKNMNAGREADWSTVKGYGKNFDGVGYPQSVEEIERLLENITATCTSAGTGEMVWYCTVCGARVKVETVPVAALGHKVGEKIENEVAPTCGEDGSYEAVQYCVRCGEEYSRKKVVVPATGDHKFGDLFIQWYGEDVVDYNSLLMSAPKKDYHFGLRSIVGSPAGRASNYNQDYFVYANAEHTCTVCGQTHPASTFVHLDIVGEVQKSTKAGYPGTITLRAYHVADGNLNKVIIEDTKTFNYYTSMDEYTARVIEPPVEPVQPEPETPDEPEINLPAIDAATFKAANAGNNKVQLTWSAVEDADGYLILKNGSQIAYTTGATSYLDRNASSEEFSYYWVIPYAKTAKGTVKGELSNYVWAIGRTVLQVKAVSAEATEDGVALSWEPASGANGYVVLSKSGSDKAAFNAPVEVSGTSCVVKAESGQVQYYWVYGTYTNGDGHKVAAGKVSPFAWAVAK